MLGKADSENCLHSAVSCGTCCTCFWTHALNKAVAAACTCKPSDLLFAITNARSEASRPKLGLPPPSSRCDTVPTAKALPFAFRNGKHLDLLRRLFIPAQPQFLQWAFSLFSATGCRSWSRGLRGPLADADAPNLCQRNAAFSPRKLTWSSRSTCSRVPFAADCGFHVHVRQDLFNGLLCEVSQSKFYKHLETHPALRSYAYMHTLQAAPAGTFPLHCEYICS